jgi:hypothetical protein
MLWKAKAHKESKVTRDINKIASILSDCNHIFVKLIVSFGV